MPEETVYAVMRGGEFKALYRHRKDAEWYRDHLDNHYTRGTRHAVVPIILKENNA